ncbi:hypothetical protein CHS0354_009808 [Potamilus streckersoni]|uniref:DZIP3-like HEPN domain-containing protein n=1 Tax=Potamilus streckersoni TaxID=2493646 RepID=A0AAE0W342_9BIVA|nr:hypothetical protein CHS0354_009808 [Potamilus streckersoni]
MQSDVTESRKVKMERATSSKYTSTRESQNFAKLSRLFVELLRDVLWETLTKIILPEDIPDKVHINKQKLETAGKMREEQYMRICKPGRGEVTNEDFDITLLYMLLRNLPMGEKKIQRPSKKWGSDVYPEDKNQNEGDDIERIRLRRNEVFGHVTRASLPDAEFGQIWSDMLAVVKRFDIRLKTTFESEMEVILKDEMSSDFAEDYMRDFKRQKEHDLQTREIAMEAKREAEEVKKLTEKTLEVTEYVKRRQTETDRMVDDLAKDIKMKKKDAEREPNETLKLLLDKTRDKLKHLKPEREYFHPTNDFNHAMDILLNKNRKHTVFLSGNPGEGKTTIGYMLLLEMEKMWKTCLILKDPADAKYVTPEHVDIIMIDNIFGTVTYDNYLSGMWRHYFDDFKKWKKDKVRFIFTSRELILRECRWYLDEDFFDKDGFILLSSEKLQQEEKTEILLKQLAKYKDSKEVTLKKDEVTKCCLEFTSPFGFPLCCQIFASDIVYLRQKSNFFTRPLEALEAGIKEIWIQDANKPMFIALTAVWKLPYSTEELDLGLFAKKVKLERRLSLSNFGKEKLDDIASNLKFYLPCTFSIDEQFEKLNGVYLTQHKATSWQSEGYTFSHEVIEEAFGRVLMKMKPDAAIRYGSMQFLVNNTCTVKGSNNDKETSTTGYRESLKIPIDKHHYNDLFQKLLKSLKDPNDEFVAIHHSAFEEPNFLDFFFEKLNETGSKELQELIVRRRGVAWGFTKSSFLKEALKQNTPKTEFVRRILEKRLLDQIDDKRWVQEQKQSIFSVACRLGLFSLYELLIQEGVTITSDAFIRATIAGNTEIVEDLFRRTDIDQESAIYDKCLALASEGGFLDLVKLFRSKGANIDTESTPNKETPLYQALIHKHEDIALFLIAESADVDKIPTKKILNSCLHVACQFGHARVVDALLVKDVQIDMKNKNCVTPLHLALMFKHKEIAKKLIEKGCDINLSSGRLDKTPLHISSEMGLREISEILLEKGADPMAKDKKGHSPMHYASMYGHKDIVVMLIKQNADQSESRSLKHRQKNDMKGLTPIHYAARRGRVDVLKSLIQSGVSADLPDMYGRSPLYLAARFGQQEVVNELLKENIDVNCKEYKYGFTPLHIATDRRHARVVEKLCQHNNMQINLRDISGRTALHIASVHGDKLVMKFLLQFHADPRSQNENLDTPLHLAKNAGVADMLLAKDSSVMNLRNKDGIAPFEIARENKEKDSDVLKVFEKYKENIEVNI